MELAEHITVGEQYRAFQFPAFQSLPADTVRTIEDEREPEGLLPHLALMETPLFTEHACRSPQYLNILLP